MKKTPITVSGLSLYVNADTRRLKVGARGKATPAPELYRQLGKGEARRLRKALRRAGLLVLAGIPAL